MRVSASPSAPRLVPASRVGAAVVFSRACRAGTVLAVTLAAPPEIAVSMGSPSAPSGAGGEVTVELAGAHVRSITAGGVTIPRRALLTGRSSGAALSGPSDLPVTAADDLDLATYFGRSGSSPVWRVEFGAWQDSNGAAPDFFVFEAGGNDVLGVAPLFPDGRAGEPIKTSAWQPVGYTVPHGPNAGQGIHVLALSVTDLRDAAGEPLEPDAVLAGLQFESATIDGAVVAAAHPAPPPPGVDGDGSLALSAAPRTWHPLEVTLLGPWASELDVAPNPFLDLRMTVIFRGPDGGEWRVPGFFDADGAGGDEGCLWRARFAPDRPGSWTADVELRGGPDVAVDLALDAGTAAAPGDGAVIAFHVAPPDLTAPGFLRRGRLAWVGDHYRRFADGTRFLRGGTNSPENLFAYLGFDGIRDAGGIGLLHRYAAHRHLWEPGDPLFASDCGGDDSRGIVGALRYLAAHGVNSIYVVPMNLGGDGQDTAPFVGYAPTTFDKTHYDTSRLAQWCAVLELAQRLGISPQLVLSETEWQNEQWLDGGLLGRERKLYFRELVARFGHLLALRWNLAEESDFTIAELRDHADWLRAIDPYDHPIGFHNHPNDLSDFAAVAGDPRFELVSVQYDAPLGGGHVETLRALSAAAGRPWIVGMDEVTPWNVGATDTNAAELRRTALWDTYLSGGQVEWYLGFHDLPLGGDLTLEDFSTREELWTYTRHARRFAAALPLERMAPADELSSGAATVHGGAEVLAWPRVVYAVYLPSAGTTGTLDLSGARGRFLQRWYDPRTGEFRGEPRIVLASAAVPLGPPPSAPAEDWAVVLWSLDLVEKTSLGTPATGG